jgi:hypothetical protein
MRKQYAPEENFAILALAGERISKLCDEVGLADQVGNQLQAQHRGLPRDYIG